MSDRPRRMTPTERRWVSELDDVFARMPATLRVVECADDVFVVDRDSAKCVPLADGEADKAGVVLARVPHARFKITGVSG